MATNGTMYWPTLGRWNDIDTFERNEHFRKMSGPKLHVMADHVALATTQTRMKTLIKKLDQKTSQTPIPQFFASAPYTLDARGTTTVTCPSLTQRKHEKLQSKTTTQADTVPIQT